MKVIGDREILSVGEVNGLAKEVLETMSFWVEGEIYDFKSANSRYYYIYFQLKDQDGTMILPSIMLPPTFAGLDFDFDNGQKVIAHGKLTLFTKAGKYQFLVDTMELAGQGQLAKELERLKAALQAEGLFDDGRKRPLPPLVQKVGVITSATSDAWADFQRHSVDKFPLIELYLVDVYVQGPKAVNSILRALQLLQHQPLDVIVLTRGGGSLEDLAAFNDEKVVRAVAASSIPTLVGVGHEKDVSIADLVADVRASTPTNAGQILTKPYEQAVSTLLHQRSQLQRLAGSMVDQPGQELDQLMRHLLYSRHKYQALPYQLTTLASNLQRYWHQLTDGKAVLVQTLDQKLQASGQRLQIQSEQRLATANKQLQAVSPLAILQRGYSLVEVNDRIVRSSHQVKQGDTMHIRLHKGGLRGLITRVEE
jgi:exodeoxyribonuclease VII large subunit